MKRSEENFLNMVHSVLDNLRKNQSIWTSESVIVKEVNAIERDYNQILGNLNHNSRLDSGVVYDTLNEDLNSIIRATIKLCRRMYLYARLHNDEIIRKLVDHTESTLAHGSDRVVIHRCHTILSRAEWMHFYLKPYKVSSAQLAKLHNLIDVYEQSHSDRSKISNVAHKPTLSHQITELKERLAILDELIMGLIKNSMFISEYHNSRILIDYSETLKTESNRWSDKTVLG
jgi:hypothetical protein